MTAGIEYADLSLETMHCAVHQRLAELHAGVVKQITRGEIVGTVDDEIDAVEQTFDVIAAHTLGDGIDARAWIERGQCKRCGFDFPHTDARFGMQNLSLQIAAVHDIVVGDPQRADACSRKIVRRRRTKPACADQQHACGFEFALAFNTDLRQTQMTRIALGEIRVDVADRRYQRQ